jgi:glycosyltransferase involved in cell wall biosynthesis
MDVLSVVIPMLNEESLAEYALTKVRGACADLASSGVVGDYEIVVVDDGSTDQTPQILERLAREDQRLRIVKHPANRGLGGSLQTGFARAGGSLVLYMDADLPFDLAEIAKACALVREDGVGIVSAYRRERTVEGLRRTVYSFVYNALVRTMFGLRIRDVNFAFKICRRELLDRIHLRSEGSFIDVEILVGAQRCGYRITQFDVEFFPRTRGVSTLSSVGVILQILSELLRFRLQPAGKQLPSPSNPGDADRDAPRQKG